MNWAYLAGFTDGDGCISVERGRDKKYLYSRLRWHQKAETSQVLDEIAEFLKAQGFKVSLRNFSVAIKGHKYPQRELGITNAEDTRKALIEMIPFLVVKRKRALEMLAIMNEVAAAKAQYGNKYRAHQRRTA